MTEAEAKALSEWFKVRKGKTLKLNDKGIDMVCEALEKQIAKKPLFSTIHNDTAYHCSGCKEFVGFLDTHKYAYCHRCGQKLKWQDSEV